MFCVTNQESQDDPRSLAIPRLAWFDGELYWAIMQSEGYCETDLNRLAKAGNERHDINSVDDLRSIFGGGPGKFRQWAAQYLRW